MPKEIKTIADLQLDLSNVRKHNSSNVEMIEMSLHEVGAARSIVVDEDGVILAGNATVEAAANVGIEEIQVVDVDGGTIVAVRRKGLTEAQKKRLALFDNRSAELAQWDIEALAIFLEQDKEALEGLWHEEELRELLADNPFGAKQPEYDESAADGVSLCVCHACGNEHSRKGE